MINETAEKITLLFYKLWTTKGVVTNEVMSIKINDDEASLECGDDTLREALLLIADNNCVLLKNALAFMMQKRLFSCNKKVMLDGTVMMFGIVMNHEAIDMIEGAVSGNRNSQSNYNKTFALNIKFNLFDLGALVDGRLGDLVISLLNRGH